MLDPTDDQDAATKKYVDDNIAIPTGTYYWMTPGIAFKPTNPDTDAHYISDDVIFSETNDMVFFCPVNLPHGAIVTAAKVRATTETTWTLYRTTEDGTDTVMATAAGRTEDTSISSATIDNSTYKYWFKVINVDATYWISNGNITYTL